MVCVPYGWGRAAMEVSSGLSWAVRATALRVGAIVHLEACTARCESMHTGGSAVVGQHDYDIAQMYPSYTLSLYLFLHDLPEMC